MIDMVSNVMEKLSRFETFEVIEGDIWASMLNYNGIEKIDIESGNADYIDTVVDENTAHFAIKKCISCNDVLFFIEQSGEHMWSYDIHKGNKETYFLSCDSHDSGNVIGVFTFLDKIVIVKNRDNALYFYDLKTRKLQKKSVFENFDLDKSIIYRCDKWGDYICICVKRNARVMIYRYDLQTEEVKVCDCAGLVGDIRGFCCDNDMIFFLDSEWNLYFFKIYTQELDKISLTQWMDQKDLQKENFFGNIAVTKQNIWLLPSMGENIYVYDFDNQTAEKFENYPEKFGYDNTKNWSKSSEVKKIGNKIYVALRLSNYFLIIDYITGKPEWKKIQISDNEKFYKKYIDRIMREKTEVLEEKILPLEKYIHLEIDREKESALFKGIGCEIWKETKE